MALPGFAFGKKDKDEGGIKNKINVLLETGKGGVNQPVMPPNPPHPTQASFGTVPMGAFGTGVAGQNAKGFPTFGIVPSKVRNTIYGHYQDPLKYFNAPMATSQTADFYFASDPRQSVISARSVSSGKGKIVDTQSGMEITRQNPMIYAVGDTPRHANSIRHIRETLLFPDYCIINEDSSNSIAQVQLLQDSGKHRSIHSYAPSTPKNQTNNAGNVGATWTKDVYLSNGGTKAQVMSDMIRQQI